MSKSLPPGPYPQTKYMQISKYSYIIQFFLLFSRSFPSLFVRKRGPVEQPRCSLPELPGPRPTASGRLRSLFPDRRPSSRFGSRHASDHAHRSGNAHSYVYFSSAYYLTSRNKIYCPSSPLAFDHTAEVELIGGSFHYGI